MWIPQCVYLRRVDGFIYSVNIINVSACVVRAIGVVTNTGELHVSRFNCVMLCIYYVQM